MITNDFQIIELVDILSSTDSRVDSVTAACTDPNRMFDRATGITATCTDPLVVVITPVELVNGVSFFGLVAADINITVDDPTEGEVYNKDFSLVDLTDIGGFWDWYFVPLSTKTQLAIVDLPPFPAATITITIENDGSTVEVSELSIGRVKILGDTVFGTGIGSKSYSTKEVNETTGAVTLEKGNSRKTRDFVVTVSTGRLPYIYKLLDNIDGVEAVFIGNSDLEELIIFGYSSSYNLLMSNHTTSDLLIYAEEIKA